MFRRVPWTVVGLFVLSGLVGMARETDDPWIRGVFTGKSPRPVAVAETEAWQRANNLADHTFRGFVLVGSGQSMQPLYTPGTILVLQQLPYGRLERGQTVLYRNQRGKVVAHVLVAKVRDGWRVAGLNNSIHDMEPVQAENLVAVVIAAFQPLPGGRAVRVAMTGN